MSWKKPNRWDLIEMVLWGVIIGMFITFGIYSCIIYNLENIIYSFGMVMIASGAVYIRVEKAPKEEKEGED